MKYYFIFFVHLLGFSVFAQKESEYSKFWSFSNGFSRVQKNGLMGFIDTNFNEVIPCQFYWVNNFHKSGHGLATITDSTNSFGFINRKGEIVLEPKYEMVYFFEDSVDLVYVFDGQYYGWMNQFGVEVIPCELDQTVSTPEHFHNGKVRVKKNGLYGQMDQFGNTTINCKYNWICGFDNESGLPNTDWLAVKGTNNDYFYLNQETGEERKLEYEFVGEFKDGFSMVKKDGLYGFVDASLKLVIPCIYNSVQDFSNGRASVENEEKKWGLIDARGNLLLDYTYDYIYPFFDGKARVRIHGEELMDTDKRYPTRVGDKFGYIDRQGNPLTPIKYDDDNYGYNQDSSHPHLVLSKNGKSILVNKEFKRVSRKKYDNIIFSNRYYLNADVLIDRDSNYCLGFRNDLFYPINRDGNEMTRQGSKRMFFFVEGVSMYQDKNELCGFIDYKGNIIIPAEYTYFSYRYFKNGTVVMEKDGKKGIIDKKGEIIVPFEYESLQNFNDGYALGKRDGYFYFINQLGAEVLSSKMNN